jgi:RsiW-degrading membrane proteinase PrsW (M82 family)
VTTNGMDIEQLAYNEAIRSIDQQQIKLDEIRSRIGALFSATSIATAFLASQALAQEIGKNGKPKPTTGVPLLGWFAIGTYVAVLACLIFIFWKRKFRFRFNAKTIIEDYRALPIKESYEKLAGYREDQFKFNEPKLNHMLWAVIIGAVLTTTDIVLWLVLLGQSR